MITFDPQELTEIIQAVSSANNTDAMPAYSWARAAKVLLAEVERLWEALDNRAIRDEISNERVTPFTTIQFTEAEKERLRQDWHIAIRSLAGKEGDK